MFNLAICEFLYNCELFTNFGIVIFIPHVWNMKVECEFEWLRSPIFDGTLNWWPLEAIYWKDS